MRGARKMTNLFIDVASRSLNKYKEELCGDKVEFFKSDNKTILVLADGLGSGVKANILATLTTKIAITMLKNGETIEDTFDTVMRTLPVCQIRQIAYSTMCIVEMDHEGNGKLYEYDNPPVFIVQKGVVKNLQKTVQEIQGKTIKTSTFKLEEDDYITVISDGVVHAGIGHLLNHGWEWEHVADFLSRQAPTSAEYISRRLVEACAKLYENMPGDDTTVATLMYKRPEVTQLFSGPPENPKNDKAFVDLFMKTKGLKIVSGGTAAKIVSRETHKEIVVDDYIDCEVPPTAIIEGIDLVTEGVLTLRKTLEILDHYKSGQLDMSFSKKDGATKLADLLIHRTTHITFWIGKAINPAHQNPDFPIELSIKLNVLERLVQSLKEMGKVVTVHYI